MTRKEWAALAAMLAAYYPHSFKMESTGQVQAWYEALADLPGDLVKASILHMVRTQPAFPSIADIRKHAEAEPSSAATAWAEVMQKVGSVGYMGTPEWSDPRIARAVEALGGWREVCGSERSSHPAMRAQFRMAFEAETEARSRQRTFEQLGVTLGSLGLQAPKTERTIENGNQGNDKLSPPPDAERPAGDPG